MTFSPLLLSDSTASEDSASNVTTPTASEVRDEQEESAHSNLNTDLDAPSERHSVDDTSGRVQHSSVVVEATDELEAQPSTIPSPKLNASPPTFDEVLRRLSQAITSNKKQAQQTYLLNQQVSRAINRPTINEHSRSRLLSFIREEPETPDLPNALLAMPGTEDEIIVPPNTPNLSLNGEIKAQQSLPNDKVKDSVDVTPILEKVQGKCKTDGLKESREIPPYSPYRCNLDDPADICIDDFLRSQTFEFICAQAFQLAAILPIEPPPQMFYSFAHTPMHQWYQTLLMEFIDTFERILHERKKFPKRPELDKTRNYYSGAPYASHMLKLVDDEGTFQREANIHCNIILASFRWNWHERPLGNQDNLSIDKSQPNAHYATLALREVTSYSEWAPKKDWKVGEKLHPEFKRRLRNFDAGVVRLIGERPQDRWVLDLPNLLARGTAAYKEYFIAQLRRGYLVEKGVEQLSYMPVMEDKRAETQEYDDVFL